LCLYDRYYGTELHCGATDFEEREMCDFAAPEMCMTLRAADYDNFDDDDDDEYFGGSQQGSAAAADEKSSSVYLSVISQQTFIGCWKLNAELSSLLGVSLAQLQNSAPVKVRLIYDFW